MKPLQPGEKIQVTFPDSLVVAVEGTVTMVHPDGETVSARIDDGNYAGPHVIGVVFAEDGVPRQVFVKRGVRHHTYRRLVKPSVVGRALAYLRATYHDVVKVLSGGAP